MIFSRIESSAKMPSFFLSSVPSHPIPDIIAPRSKLIAVFLPLMKISPWSAVSMPKMSFAISVRPEPRGRLGRNVPLIDVEVEWSY